MADILAQYSIKKVMVSATNLAVASMAANQLNKLMPIPPALQGYGLTTAVAMPGVEYLTAKYLFNNLD